MNEHPDVVFEGRTYYWARRGDGFYYVARGAVMSRLHRDVWESVNGPVPYGMIVHHKDWHADNNSPSNLEIMTRAQHRRLHGYFCGELLSLTCPMCSVSFVSKKKTWENRRAKGIPDSCTKCRKKWHNSSQKHKDQNRKWQSKNRRGLRQGPASLQVGAGKMALNPPDSTHDGQISPPH